MGVNFSRPSEKPADPCDGAFRRHKVHREVKQ